MKSINVATKSLKNKKVIVVALSALVVLVTAFMLILPALALDEETAESQGGIEMSAGQDTGAALDATDQAVPEDEDAGDMDDADADAVTSDGDADAGDVRSEDKDSGDTDAAAASGGGVLTASDEDKTYIIEVAYGRNAGIPDDAELVASEITEETEGYDDYIERTQEALGEGRTIAFARFFDIKIMCGDMEIQPADDVEVMIEVPDKLKKKDVSAIHFVEPEDGKDKTEDVVLETEVSKSDTKKMESAVSFETDGFSVYAVVTAKPLDTDVSIDGLDGNGFYLSIDNNQGRYYFKDSLNGNYIEKTNAADIDSAALYYFESAGDSGKFYIYTLDSDHNKKYVYMADKSYAFAFSADDRTAFNVESNTVEGTFYIYNLWSTNKKCAWSYDNSGFIGKTQNPGDSNRIVLTKPIGNDPYELDGKSFGILNSGGSSSGTGMLTTATSNNTRLKGLSMTIRTEPVGRIENVYVAKDSDIAMWTFQSIGGDQYYITSESGKYLRIDDTSVKLVNELDENCKITVKSGTGNFKNKYMFTCGNQALCLNSGNFTRTAITTSANNKNVWMNLAALSNLTEEDFVTYTAQKVSVSGEVKEDGTIDYDVKDGDQIVIYTRIWNDDKKQYEYYIVDYDGMLIKGYASSDTISWVGSRVNTMLWDFTEYHYDDGTPNYYYELQNHYTGEYIAPQVSKDELLSDSKIGLNLNGRRNGQYYTTIIAWDDRYYDYAGLYVRQTDHWQVIPAPLAKVDTFYFAVMKKEETQDEVEPVETVDHTKYGIKVKMQDYGDETMYGNNYRSAEMTDVIGNTPFDAGSATKDLLKKNITEDYPTAVLSGKTLGSLFDDAMEVNHQFLTGTYNETGYFEYDSTQNFAHLIWEDSDPWIGRERPDGGTYQKGDFVVYEQLATTSESNKYTLQHGQFLPYNDIGHWEKDEEGNDVFVHNPYSTNSNEMDMHSTPSTAVPLSSLDPRKGEKLINIPYEPFGEIPEYADHFFGVEMSASFMQSASGLDDWGHDLIFEFSGDDDFWLYIDDKLVMDLGGIHSALDGSINFKTGQVVVNKGTTNLRELYKEAYLEANPDATEDEVTKYLDGIFKDSPTLKDKNGNPIKTVFKDYSGHTMRMFYMERGAGASNLHMRFNLAPYKDGEVLLEKEVSGAETVAADTEFPFQIWYYNTNVNEYQLVDSGNFQVLDNQTKEPIKYRPSYSAGDVTYPKVFFLKAGQTASIALPDEDTKYFIRECGMDTETFDKVAINGEDVEGAAVPGTDPLRKDYETAKPTTVAQCKKVIYNNHVDLNAQHSLRITKKLYETFDKKPEGGIPAEEDDTLFCFRIFIGQNSSGNYIAYNTGKYHVLNPAGEYCIFNYGTQQFQSTHKTDFDELSDIVPPGQWKSEKENATFATSPGGAADKIPAGYTVEVPGLMDGTPFRVIERADEIPPGYNLIDYERVDDVPSGETDNSGVITKNEGVIVSNQHGYGIAVKKNWSDKDFMESHDPIYFAVFVKEKDAQGNDVYTMKDHSIRQLGETETSIRWFYRDLDEGKSLRDYFVYEMQIVRDGQVVDPSEVPVDPDTGEVTVPDGAAIRIIREGETLTVGGTSGDHGYSADYKYTASYDWETPTQEEIDAGLNSKTDKVTNSRPGIKLVKTDMEGNPLKDGKFSLEKVGDPSTKKTFVSDEAGLIAVAYLPVGTEYKLTEVAAPYQHKTLISDVTIRVGNDNTVYVNDSPEDSSKGYYTIKQVATPTVNNMPTVTIKNKPFGLKAVKEDAITDMPIEGIKFGLYREVDDYNGNPMPDYYPMNPRDQFGNLVTGEDGIIPKINLNDLQPGTYYLHEEETPAQYEKIDYYIRLIIDPTGPITIQRAVFSKARDMYVFDKDPSGRDWPLDPETEAKIEPDKPGSDNLTLTIYNQPTKAVRIIKKSYDANEEYQEGVPLAGAEFSLYKSDQIGEDGQPKPGEEPILTGITSDEEGKIGHLDLGTLTTGREYYLFETKEPEGYDRLTDSVIISVRESGMVEASYGISHLRVTKVTEDGIEISQIIVLNSAGVELPSTGGSGTTTLYLLGGLMILLAGTGLFLTRRRRKIRL